jgi:hypothetical protein
MNLQLDASVMPLRGQESVPEISDRAKSLQVKKLVETFNQFQVAVAAIAAILATIGVDKAGLINTLQNPIAWTAREVLFFGLVAVVLAFILLRQRYQNVSRLKDTNGLRLEPTEPRHLLGRGEDLSRILRALDRELVFLVGDSGSGKSALLQAGICHDPAITSKFLPVYVDLAELDWDEGLLFALWDRFRQALPDDERKSYPGGVTQQPDDLMAAFELYNEKLGRRPLLLFDQFEDYEVDPIGWTETGVT